MAPEFRALGIDHSKRGKITDETLDFFRRCFEHDVVEENGQRFLFRPRPVRPPIFVGGSAPLALQRAVRFGDGWMPIGVGAEQLAPLVRTYRKMAEDAGKPSPEVVVATALALDDPPRAAADARALAEVGVTRLAHGWRYNDAAAFHRAAETMATVVRDALRN